MLILSYESLEILRSYKTNKNDIIKEFYLPILKESVLYKRAVGFFSSTALIELSKGISGLIKNGGKIKFIVSPLLSEEDIVAIQKGYDEKEIIKDSLLREFKEPQNDSESERLNWLAHLISNGHLDIKVAFTLPSKTTGMYHEKIGIIYDKSGNKVAFTGSMNETTNAFHNNFESIQVFNSLKQEDYERVVDIDNDFDSLWSGREDNIKIVDFPDVIKQKLISYKKDIMELNIDIEDLKIEEQLTIAIPGIPVMPHGVQLYDYQYQAIDNWAQNGYCGIFDMATGTGKTFTGLGAIVRLFSENKRLAVIIVCPYQHLVEQWTEDIKLFNMLPTIGYSSSKQKDWKKRLENDITDFSLGIIDCFCFVTTNATYSSKFVVEQISKLGKDTLLLIDEAHNFGSSNLRNKLFPQIQYRLALSATLERHMDEDGTQILKNYFGRKCIVYDLKRAIKEKKLTPYYYYPILVYFEEDEIEQYTDISYKISKECYIDKTGKFHITDKGKMLLLQRAQIVAGAKNKLIVLKDLMQKYKNDTHILVYCGATKTSSFDKDETEYDEYNERQISAVSKLLGNELNMKVTHFTSNESSAERELIKKKFTNADPYQALVAIKCLDEGVNIPSIKTAFILASTTNPKEYIQRRGRVLRLAENKPYAVIYDFITLVKPLSEVNPFSFNYSCERALAKREWARIKEFGEIALNSRDSDELINELESVYQIKCFELEDIDDESEFRREED